MDDLSAWIPVIMAVLGFATALLQKLGKDKAVKVVEVLVDQVESWNDDTLKRNVRDMAEIRGVGPALHKVVAKRTK